MAPVQARRASRACATRCGTVFDEEALPSVHALLAMESAVRVSVRDILNAYS